MSGIINRFFNKKVLINEELLALADRLSFRNSQLDSFLMEHFFKGDKTGLDEYFAFQKQLLELQADRFESIQIELDLLKQYLKLIEHVVADGFSVKWENKLPCHEEIMLPPLIFFPMIQHAVKNGYNTLSSHPVRIRLSGSSKVLILEVSYRVNHYLEDQFSDTLLGDFQKRLAHLFPQKHNLLLNSNSNTARVTLSVQLF